MVLPSVSDKNCEQQTGVAVRHPKCWEFFVLSWIDQMRNTPLYGVYVTSDKTCKALFSAKWWRNRLLTHLAGTKPKERNPGARGSHHDWRPNEWFTSDVPMFWSFPLRFRQFFILHIHYALAWRTDVTGGRGSNCRCWWTTSPSHDSN